MNVKNFIKLLLELSLNKTISIAVQKEDGNYIYYNLQEAYPVDYNSSEAAIVIPYKE